MLFWSKFFILCVFLALTSIAFSVDSLVSTMLTVEFISILIFFIYTFNALILNIYWLFSTSLVILVLAGLEISLALLLLSA